MELNYVLQHQRSRANESRLEQLRTEFDIKRYEERSKYADSVRVGVEELSDFLKEMELITEEDIAGMALRIKRRRHADEADLNRLSHAFLQSPDNSIAFVNIPGALDVLIKELTGKLITKKPLNLFIEHN